MRVAFAVVFSLASLACPALAASESDALRALEEKRSAAIAAHDTAFLNSIYAEDFRGLTALGFQVDKAMLMEVFARDNPATRFTLDEIEPRIYGEAAVVTGRLTGRDAKGATISQSRYIHVYVRKDGKWLIVAGQGTVIPPEQRK
jgi:ketosteroid isomerase-like protein